MAGFYHCALLFTSTFLPLHPFVPSPGNGIWSGGARGVLERCSDCTRHSRTVTSAVILPVPGEVATLRHRHCLRSSRVVELSHNILKLNNYSRHQTLRRTNRAGIVDDGSEVRVNIRTCMKYGEDYNNFMKFS